MGPKKEGKPNLKLVETVPLSDIAKSADAIS